MFGSGSISNGSGGEAGSVGSSPRSSPLSAAPTRSDADGTEPDEATAQWLEQLQARMDSQSGTSLGGGSNRGSASLANPRLQSVAL